MNTADALIHVWAASKCDVPIEKIERVEFIHEDAYSYSEYTEEPAYTAAWVHLTEALPDALSQPSTRREIFIDADDLGGLLREILEVAGEKA